MSSFEPENHELTDLERLIAARVRPFERSATVVIPTPFGPRDFVERHAGLHPGGAWGEAIPEYLSGPLEALSDPDVRTVQWRVRK